MSEISTEVGKRIRTFRKMRHMTLEELAAAVCKSKSTVSKYEKGEIAVDIETLYELAAALHVRAEQLLLFRPEPFRESFPAAPVPDGSGETPSG